MKKNKTASNGPRNPILFMSISSLKLHYACSEPLLSSDHFPPLPLLAPFSTDDRPYLLLHRGDWGCGETWVPLQPNLTPSLSSQGPPRRGQVAKLEITTLSSKFYQQRFPTRSDLFRRGEIWDGIHSHVPRCRLVGAPQRPFPALNLTRIRPGGARRGSYVAPSASVSSGFSSSTGGSRSSSSPLRG